MDKIEIDKDNEEFNKMKKFEEYTKIIDDIKTFITCYICFDILENPLKCKTCETSFCGKCVNIWYLESKECPLKCKNTEFLPSCKITRYLIDKFKHLEQSNLISSQSYTNSLNNNLSTTLSNSSEVNFYLIRISDWIRISDIIPFVEWSLVAYLKIV